MQSTVPMTVRGLAVFCGSMLVLRLAAGADPVSFNGAVLSGVGRNTDGNGLPSGHEVAVGNNPYSEVVIPVAGGDWLVGDVLVGNWNDPTNTLFGQGNTLTLVRGASAVRTYTYPRAPGTCDPANFNGGYQGSGFGFTMAAAWLGNGYVLQCSLPISNNSADPNAAGPGCCIVINSVGTIVAEFANNGINGPWGATAVLPSNPSGNVTVFLSNAFGGSQGYGANQGSIQRYSFQVPTSDAGWRGSRFAGRLGGAAGSPGSPGTLGNPVQIFPTGSETGFHSMPANVSMGAVGPAGLAYSPVTDNLYAMGTVSDPAPFGSIYKIPNPIKCQGPTCVRSPLVRCAPNVGQLAQGKCSGCNGPIGAVFYSGSQGNFLFQANGQDGCINQYTEAGQLVSSIFADGTVDAAGNNPGQGNLFNLAFANVSPTPSLLIVDDNANAVFLNPLNVLAGTPPADTASAGRRKLMMS